MTRTVSLKLLLCASALVTPSVAFAQNEGDAPIRQNSTAFDEIVVTAQKRSQAINDIGLSITAVSGDALAQRGIVDAADLVKVVPGMNYTPTAFNSPVYTLRGIGFFDNALAAAPAVSVYVDEVPLSFSAMTNGATLDLERVEVIKGPQGTLYGQNSTGGAINFIAAKPTATPQAGLDVSFGRFATVEASGFVSGPISDTLRARFAVRTTQSGDWQRSTTRNETLGQMNNGAARLLLDFEPGDRIRFSLNLNGWFDKSDTLAGQVTSVSPAVPELATPFLLSYADRFPTNARDADWNPDSPMRNDNRYYEASLRATFDLSDQLTVTSISSWQDYKQDLWSDVDATAEAQNEYNSFGRIKAFNQELRLSGSTDAIDWIVGANYAWGKIDDDQMGYVPDVTVNQPIPFLPRFRDVYNDTDTKVNTYAAFGNVEVRLNDNLSVIGGLRYTKSDRSFAGCSRVSDPTVGTVFETFQLLFKGSFQPIGVGECITLDTTLTPGLAKSELNEDNLSIRAGVNYKTDGGTLLYASFNRGYKAGGYPILVATNVEQLSPVVQEEVLAYEAGIKAQFADRRLQLNAAAFYYDYTNKQLKGRLFHDIFQLLELLVNIPKSRVIGGEVELRAQPVEGLDLSIAATYVDSKVKQFSGYDLSPNISDLSGSQFPYTPKLTAVADAEYRFGVGHDVEAFIGATARHSGQSYAAFAPDDRYRIRPYTVLDLRAGVQGDHGQWRLSLWGRNVTNEYYWNSVFRSTDEAFRQAARPVTYGVSFSARFGK